MGIALQTDSGDVYDRVSQRYSSFVSDAAPEFTVDLSVGTPEQYRSSIYVRADGGAWRLTSHDFDGNLDLDRRCGRICHSPESYAYDSALRIAYSFLTAMRGGFLLHAASAARNGRAYVFAGVSGAGKTTLTRLGPPDVTILTDEIAHVLPAAGGYVSSGTPFFGEFGRPGENVSVPIEGLFLLAKGPENRLDDIPPAEACRMLMRNILFFGQDAGLGRRIFDSALDFVRRIPVRLLTFRPEPSVWDLIE